MIHTIRSLLTAVALCIMVACDRPAATSPETGSTSTADASRQSLRGIVRHAADQWELELSAGTVVQLTGAIDQVAAFEGREAVVTGILRGGVMVVESCILPKPIEAEYSRR
jgi:hypothetical protein